MKKFILAGMLLWVALNVFAQKSVYIPNDFKYDPIISKQWSWDKSYQSDNFVVVTVEEMVLIIDHGAEYLSTPQQKLWLL